MFIFFTRFAIRLLTVMLVISGGVAGLARTAQTGFPPILYGDTSSYQLFTRELNCESFWASCHRDNQFVLESLYSIPVAQWSPDGEFIAVHMNDDWFIYPTYCLLVLQTCEPTLVDDASGDVRLAWGAGGAIIATYANRSDVTTTLYTKGCWDGTGDCLEKTVQLSQTSIFTEPAWSADGTRMLFGDQLQNGFVWFYTACFDQPEGCTGQLNSFSIGANLISWPSLSADGSRVLLTMDTRGNNTYQQIFMVELDTGAVRQITDRVGTAIFPDWSADERYILFSGFPRPHSGDLQIYLLDLERGITLPIVHHPNRDVAFASWGFAK